ncbi:MAG: alpha/beta hydrolase fold domain-containing protein [Pseudoxanthomonas sp.]
MNRAMLAGTLALLLAACGNEPPALPEPTGLSPQAVAALKANAARPPAKSSAMADRRAWSEAVQQEIGQPRLKRYAVTLRERRIAGVPVREFTTAATPADAPILLNLHGGGFLVDAGSITENVPVAGLTGYRVVAVRYRLSPEHGFPDAVEDALAVWRALRAEHPHARMGLYGTSAGAILSAQLIARLRSEGEPLPVALGFFSGSADLATSGDSMALFGDPAGATMLTRMYLRLHDIDDPLASPARGDLSNWPPTLCLASSRDILLSATTEFCRRLDMAGVPSRLLVHDGLPHAFWAYIDAPETDEAFAAMARFFSAQLGGTTATSSNPREQAR